MRTISISRLICVIAIVGSNLSGCGILDSDSDQGSELFIVAVDSIDVPFTVAPNDTLTLPFWGFVGPDGCHSFSHFEAEEIASRLDITLWGTREINAQVCPAVVVTLRGKQYHLPPPHQNNITIVVHQPDGTTLTRQITVN